MAIVCVLVDNNGTEVMGHLGGLGRDSATGIPRDLLIVGKDVRLGGSCRRSCAWELSINNNVK